MKNVISNSCRFIGNLMLSTKFLLLIPIIIGIVRILHFKMSGYVLPDEALYAYVVKTYWEGGTTFQYSTRIIYQLFLLSIGYLIHIHNIRLFFVISLFVFSIMSAGSIFIFQKIVKNQIKKFEKKDNFAVMLFAIAPSFLIISATILSEISGLFFVLLYLLLIQKESKTLIFISGIFLGLAIHIREPYLICIVISGLYFLFRRQIKKLLFLIPSTIISINLILNQIVRSISPYIYSILNNVIAKDIPIVKDVNIHVENKYLPIPSNINAEPVNPKLNLFLFTKTTMTSLVLLVLLGIGIFGILFIILSIKSYIKCRQYDKTDNYLIFILLNGLGVYIFMALYMGRIPLYSGNFTTTLSSFLRFGYQGLFILAFTSLCIREFSFNRILKMASIIGILSLVILPIFVIASQTNLSVQYLNRAENGYESPWMQVNDCIGNEGNVIIIAEPYLRMSLFAEENVKVIQIPSEERLKEILQSDNIIYFYGEKHAFHIPQIQQYTPWYYTTLCDKQKLEILIDNEEFYLYKWIG